MHCSRERKGQRGTSASLTSPKLVGKQEAVYLCPIEKSQVLEQRGKRSSQVVNGRIDGRRLFLRLGRIPENCPGPKGV